MLALKNTGNAGSDRRMSALAELLRIAPVEFFREYLQVGKNLALMRLGDAINIGLRDLRWLEAAGRLLRRRACASTRTQHGCT